MNIVLRVKSFIPTNLNTNIDIYEYKEVFDKLIKEKTFKY